MPPITVVAIHVAKPGSEADLESALLALIPPTRKEDGFLTYDLHRGLDDPRVFIFYELWESRSHLDAHAKSFHLEQFRAKRGDWVERSEVHVLQQIG